MKFKHPFLADEFNDATLHPVIRAAANMLDGLILSYKYVSPNATVGEFTVTCIHRPDDLNSYHSKWQALDARIHDWDLIVKRKMSLFLAGLGGLTRGKFQFEFEPSERHPDSTPHLHLEWDDGTI